MCIPQQLGSSHQQASHRRASEERMEQEEAEDERVREAEGNEEAKVWTKGCLNVLYFS